jgi:hypothetical protein
MYKVKTKQNEEGFKDLAEAMDNAELAVVLKPRHDVEWPEFVNLLKLWK